MCENLYQRHTLPVSRRRDGHVSRDPLDRISLRLKLSPHTTRRVEHEEHVKLTVFCRQYMDISTSNLINHTINRRQHFAAPLVLVHTRVRTAVGFVAQQRDESVDASRVVEDMSVVVVGKLTQFITKQNDFVKTTTISLLIDVPPYSDHINSALRGLS